MAARMITYEDESQKDQTQKLCETAELACVIVAMDGYDAIDDHAIIWNEWLSSDEAEGEFMVTNLIDGAFRPYQCRFYFTHDPTAFAFKIKFG